MKICEICNKEFEPINGHQKYCLPECSKIAKRTVNRLWRRRNVKPANEARRKYYQTHKAQLKEYQVKYSKEHREEISKKHAIYARKNREKINTYKRKNYNPELNRKRSRAYNSTHKEQINAYRKKYRTSTPQRTLIITMRTRISNALKGNHKSQSSKVLLGCSINDLRVHLENQFTEGMTWENYGKWHVDHILPCASFDLSKESEQIKCFNYNNLQPLWAMDNMKKGSKII